MGFASVVLIWVETEKVAASVLYGFELDCCFILLLLGFNDVL